MNHEYRTEQELFWAGEFGTNYIARNPEKELLASNIAFFSNALRHTHKIKNCIEFGANIGINLKSLKILYPQQEQYAVEINKDAIDKLRTFLPSDNVVHSSILDYSPNKQFDLVLLKGVLIHINPEYLSNVYNLLHQSMGHYLLISEYYNPTPVQISYRGYNDRLFKRDFCGEIQDRYQELKLIDYGFVYHRDPNYPQDDLTWFLLEKR